MKKAGDFDKTQPMHQHLSTADKLRHPREEGRLLELDSIVRNKQAWTNIQDIVRASFQKTVAILADQQSHQDKLLSELQSLRSDLK